MSLPEVVSCDEPTTKMFPLASTVTPKATSSRLLPVSLKVCFQSWMPLASYLMTTASKPCAAVDSAPTTMTLPVASTTTPFQFELPPGLV